MSDLGDTAECRRALYELNKTCSAGIPERGEFCTFQEYLAERIDTPAYDARGIVVAMRNDGAQYEATLHLWQDRLEAARDEALGLVERGVYRRYLRYLRVSRAMFDRRVCTLYRFTLQRRPPLSTPPTSTQPV